MEKKIKTTMMGVMQGLRVFRVQGGLGTQAFEAGGSSFCSPKQSV